MVYSVSQLLEMSQADLDSLFTNSACGSIPNGEAKSTAIMAPGIKFSHEITSFVSHFAWQGKTFDATSGHLKNRIAAFGLNAIVADVYMGLGYLECARAARRAP